jgi:hypothetical protein
MISFFQDDFARKAARRFAPNRLLTSHCGKSSYVRRLICAGSIGAMFDVGESLRTAFEIARERLQNAQAAVALANAGRLNGRSADAAMAQTAQAAIFTEVLLSAEHSRLAEIKAVTK